MSNSIEKTIELKAPVSRVWRALTDYREFGAWFRVNLDGPFEEGQISTGELIHPCCDGMKWEAVVKQIEPERLFSYTWHPYALDPGVDYSTETPTLVEFKIEPTTDGTLLVVTETGFDNVPAHRRAETFRMHDAGWAEQLKNVETYIGQNAYNLEMAI